MKSDTSPSTQREKKNRRIKDENEERKVGNCQYSKYVCVIPREMKSSAFPTNRVSFSIQSNDME